MPLPLAYEFATVNEAPITTVKEECMRKPLMKLSLASIGAWLSSAAAYADTTSPTINAGDTAWVLASAAFVLLMTPGLAFFYGGMVRTKNVVSTLFQNFATLSLIGVLWTVVGYTLAFGPTQAGLIGGFNWVMLNGVGQAPNADYAATIPHLAFMIFQCMFAIIAPALISGAVAERMSFKAWLGFASLWSLLVYAPVAHWVWGVGGWIRNLGALDFAGGFVVHMTAGYSAIVAAIMLGKRKDFGKSLPAYDTGMVLLGTALLWFGWFGFNAGSALGANGLAAQAFVCTFLGAVGASLSWVLVDTFLKGKPSAIGASIGAVVGLIAITPGSGFVSTSSALVIGLIAGGVCNFVALAIKERFKLDDSLDVFACHGVGGTIGSLLVPVFASKAVNEAGADGIIYGSFAVMKANLIATGAVIGFSVVGTFAIIKVLSFFTTVRISAQDEDAGLDSSQHAEVINSNFQVEAPGPVKIQKNKERAA